MTSVSSIRPATTPVEAIADQVEEVIANLRGYSGPDQRADQRYALAIAVRVTRFGLSGRKCGDPFEAVTRDISLSGISILCTTNICEEFLLLEWSQSGGRPFNVVLEVLRRRSIGPLWEIAGRFLVEPAG
jgi:hypothetical protein